MTENDTKGGGSEQLACPIDGCENPELNDTPDDPDYDHFCHWCGNLFESGEVES